MPGKSEKPIWSRHVFPRITVPGERAAMWSRDFFPNIRCPENRRGQFGAETFSPEYNDARKIRGSNLEQKSVLDARKLKGSNLEQGGFPEYKRCPENQRRQFAAENFSLV